MPNTPTNGNDTFTFVTGDEVTIDGLGGFDILNVNYSSTTARNYGSFNGANGSYYTGYISVSDDGSYVVGDNIEAVNIKLGSADDFYYVIGRATHATLDGGAGNDVFHGYFDDATTAIALTLNPNATTAITGTGTTIGHFEQVDISGGSAADTLTGSNGADTFNGGGGGDSISGGGGDDYIGSLDGANTLNGGAGNDTLYSTGGADHVDGGADIDSWIGNFSTATTNLTLAAGASAGSYTLTGGTTLANIENVNLTTGSGNDTATIKGGGSFYGGDGFDTLNIDHTAETVDEQGTYDGVGDGHYSSYLGGGTLNGSPNALTFITDALNVKLGSGNDSFGVYGAAAHLTVDGGAGSDTFSADYSDATAPISFALNASGATQAVGGTGTTIGHFEQVAITGGTGSDTLTGADGNDTLVAGLSIDSLTGGGGDDQLYIAGGTVNGGAGNDTIQSYTGGAETIDGGADSDTWYGHYDDATAALTFTQSATLGSFTLTGGVTLANIEYVNLTTGSGDDTFSVKTGVGYLNVNAGDGFDTLNVDVSDHTESASGGFNGASGAYYGYIVAVGSDQVGGGGIEAVDVALGSGDDFYYILGVGTQATIDGGAGTDAFQADFSDATAAVDFTLDPSAASQPIAGTATTIAHFESVNLTTGGGDDSLVGGDLADTLDGGAGRNTLLGGGGGDQLYSHGGADRVNGGADNDTWHGDYGASTANLTFTQTAPGAYTLTGGATLTSVESVYLTLGSGADTVDLKSGVGYANIQGGDGSDTLNVDVSDHTENASGGFDGNNGSGYYYSNILRVGSDAIDASDIQALNMKLGAGDDVYYILGVGAQATIDGGAGTDVFQADFSDAAAAVNFVLSATGATQKIFGTGTTIGHFESLNLTTGSGNDILSGGGGNDILDGGTGNNKLIGGAGNDQLVSHGGADTIDGGADYDTWTGDYSGVTANLTFTQGSALGTFTLTGGTTLTHVEQVNLTTGAGDDTFNLKTGSGPASIAGGPGASDGDGFDTLNIDHSGESTGEYGYVDLYDNYIGASYGGGYINGSPDPVNFSRIDALNLKLGTGADSYTVYDPNGHVTIDGGAGDDSIFVYSGAATVNGGADDDTVRFNGNYADFSISTSGAVTSVTDLRAGAPAGAATLTGVEHAQFDDQTVNIATDTPPLAHDDSGYTVAEDHTITITAASVLANDSDVNGDPLTVTAVSSAYGAASLNAAGNIVFTPGANYNGTAYLTYTVNDGTPGGDASAQITVNVTPVNDAPVAANDGAYAVVTGDTLTVTAASGQGVLANDSDVDGDTLTAVLKTGPAHGALTLGADGGFVYTPTAGYVGADSFTYRDKDPSGAFSGVATVTLSVAADHLPVAVTDTGFTLAEDHTLHTTAAALLANDTDADSGDTLSVTGVSSPYGTVTLDGAGNIAFTPYANYNGALYFNYTIADGHAGGVATGEVDVAVTPVNDAPSAADDGPYGLVTGNVLTVAAAGGVLANDSDVDGDALTAVLKAGPAHGSLTLSANGGFVYTPSAGYVGADSFTYQAKDPSAALSAVATVTLSVAADAVPLANSDGPVTILEDHTLATTAAALLANDTDADAGDTLTVTGVSSPYGTVTLGPTGDIAFIPDANSNGNESFQYTISDGHPGGTATGTVYVAVTPVNDAPVAAADAYTTRNDTALTVDAAHGVLADDSDVDGDALTAMLKTGPEHGALTLNPNGGFTYTPTASYSGSDSFTYQAKDTAGALSAAATVNLTVAANTPPVAQGDSGFTTPEDHALTIFAASLLANDSDADGDTLQLTAVSVAPGPGDGGSAALNAGGDIVYTPAANYNGQFFLRYTISDGHGGSAFGFVSGTVTPVNDAPVAAADGPYAATAGTALVVSAANGVLANDTDVDGDSLTAVLQTGVTHGALTLNGNGGFSYTATAGYAGMDSFTYLAKDPSGAGSNVVTVALAVAASGPHVINGDANPNTLTGDDGGDQINGLGGDDTLTGGKGADTLNGGPGFDTLVGGKGDDTYYVDSGGDVVREGEGGGSDTVHTTASWTATPGSQIEKIVADGEGALYLTGNALPMEIDGNSAVNKLNDGGGADTLAGGGGSDVYVVHNALTQVVEAPGAGYDAVQTDLSSYSLPANVESLTFIGTGNFSGFGNAGGNLIVGGAGDDYLDGGAGAGVDRLVGGKGDDIYVVHSAQDYVVEKPGEGTDTVMTTANSGVAAPNVEALSFIGAGDFTGFANATGVTLTGGAGNDHLYGGAGADRLVGLGGSDVLTGKGGADVFVLGGGGAGTGGGVDRVTDFHTGEDHVAFGQIVTQVLFATDTFNSATAGGGPGADYLFYDQATGRLYDEGASFAVANGHAVGGTETLIATFDAHPSLSAGDFIL